MLPISTRLRKLICACFAGITVGSSAFADPQEIFSTLPEQYEFSIDHTIRFEGTALTVTSDGRIVVATEYEGELQLFYVRIWSKQIDRFTLRAALTGRTLRCTPMYLGTDAVSASCSIVIGLDQRYCDAYIGAPWSNCSRRGTTLTELLNNNGIVCSEEDRRFVEQTVRIPGHFEGYTRDLCRL